MKKLVVIFALLVFVHVSAKAQKRGSSKSHSSGAVANTSKTTTVKVSRSAKTGQFVTKDFAKTHKSTTVTETVKRRKP